MRNNVIDATCTTIINKYYPIPVVDRIKQIFLRAKLTGAKLAGSDSEITKCKLSDHLFEMAEYSAECKKFKRAIRLTKRSLRLLSINSNCSHSEYVKRTLFLLNYNLTLVNMPNSNKKFINFDYAAEEAYSIFKILIQDKELTDQQLEELKVKINDIFQVFIDLTILYDKEAHKARNNKSVIYEMVYLNKRYTVKKRLKEIMDQFSEFLNEDKVTLAKELLYELKY